eukprot:318395-Pelagomonas_calceolata.AAC.1
MQILSLSSDQQLWAAFPVSGAASHPACPCCFFAEAALASLEAEARASEQAEAAAAEADVQALCDRWAALEAEATDKNAQQLLDLQLEQQELMQRQQGYRGQKHKGSKTTTAAVAKSTRAEAAGAKSPGQHNAKTAVDQITRAELAENTTGFCSSRSRRKRADSQAGNTRPSIAWLLGY